MTHAFFMTLGTLAGVMTGLAVFVAAAQIILRLFISPAFWGIVASLIAICTLWTIWDGHQRVVYLHSAEYKQEKAKEAEAWHQLQQQRDLRFRNSKAET
jgi:phosphate/sulfate permease